MSKIINKELGTVLKQLELMYISTRILRCNMQIIKT